MTLFAITLTWVITGGAGSQTESREDQDGAGEDQGGQREEAVHQGLHQRRLHQVTAGGREDDGGACDSPPRRQEPCQDGPQVGHR